MQGKTHAAIGGFSGAAVALVTGASFTDCLLYTAIGGVSSLVPDWLQINLPGNNQIKGRLGAICKYLQMNIRLQILTVTRAGANTPAFVLFAWRPVLLYVGARDQAVAGAVGQGVGFGVGAQAVGGDGVVDGLGGDVGDSGGFGLSDEVGGEGVMQRG